MGCFPYTCSVSSFPIVGGDRVRFLALVQNLEPDAHFVSEVDGLWQPVALPIKGVYDEYGSVAELEPGPLTDAFFEVFDTRALERPVGDNRAHDVAVVRGMSKKLWLQALWEGRVQIPDHHGAVRAPVVQTMVREDVWQLLVDECRHSDDTLRGVLRFPFSHGPFKSLTLQPALGEMGLSATVELLRVQLSLATLGRPWSHGTIIGRAEHSSWAAHQRFSESLFAIASRSETSTRA